MWIQGIVSLGLGRIRIVDLIRMRLRKISPRLVTDGVINLHKAGLVNIATDMLETHYLAGGKVQNIVSAMIAADKANIPLTFETATAIDLAGRDVFEAVQVSVNPKVISTPMVTAGGTKANRFCFTQEPFRTDAKVTFAAEFRPCK